MQIIVDWLKEQRLTRTLPHIKGDLLDVACGDGNELCRRYKASSPGRTIVGVDVFPWDGVDMVLENSASLPFPNASFDTVTCIAALNHIPERALFLKEALRILRPGGSFIMTMIPPFVSLCWHTIIKPWDKDQSERGMEHEEVYGFTRGQITGMLNAAGFRLHHEESFIFKLNTLYVAKPAVPSPS